MKDIARSRRNFYNYVREDLTERHPKIFNLFLVLALISMTALCAILISDILSFKSGDLHKGPFPGLDPNTSREGMLTIKSWQEKGMKMVNSGSYLEGVIGIFNIPASNENTSDVGSDQPAQPANLSSKAKRAFAWTKSQAVQAGSAAEPKSNSSPNLTAVPIEVPIILHSSSSEGSGSDSGTSADANLQTFLKERHNYQYADAASLDNNTDANSTVNETQLNQSELGPNPLDQTGEDQSQSDQTQSDQLPLDRSEMDQMLPDLPQPNQSLPVQQLTELNPRGMIGEANNDMPSLELENSVPFENVTTTEPDRSLTNNMTRLPAEPDISSDNVADGVLFDSISNPKSPRLNESMVDNSTSLEVNQGIIQGSNSSSEIQEPLQTGSKNKTRSIQTKKKLTLPSMPLQNRMLNGNIKQDDTKSKNSSIAASQPESRKSNQSRTNDQDRTARTLKIPKPSWMNKA